MQSYKLYGVLLFSAIAFSGDSEPRNISDVFRESEKSYKQLKEKCANTGLEEDCRFVKPLTDIDTSFDYVG